MSAASDPDEADIEASRAPLLDHLSELRTRLFWAVMAILAATVFSYLFAKDIYDWLLDPYQAAVAAEHGAEAAKQIALQYTHPFEPFFVNMKLSLFAGLILSFPVVAYQVYAFIAPGLYKRERQAVTPFLVAAPLMFAAGVAFVYFVAMPFAMRFALGFEQNTADVKIALNAKIDDYFSLITTLILAFGFVFQVPVVLALLARAGVVTAGLLRKGRRYAIVAIAAFSALVTPPDPISLFIMGVPVYVLYEASIWVVWLIEKARLKADAEAAQQAAE